MKVKDLIEELKEYNLEAEVGVLVHCHMEQFTITFGGGSEKETKENCKRVAFYVEHFCQNERVREDERKK